MAEGRPPSSVGLAILPGSVPAEDRSYARLGTNSPATPTTTTSAGAFEVFPDYSRLNKGRHNTARSDTFNTPSRLQKKSGTGPNTASAGLGTRDLLDVCELSFAKNLRDLHHSLLKDLKAEIHEALDPLKEELSGTVADARGATAFEEILTHLTNLQLPQVDLAPVNQAIDVSAMQHQETMTRLEGQLTKDVALLREEMRTAKKQQEEAEGQREQRILELEDEVRRSQIQLSKMVDMTEALCESSKTTAQEVQQIQQNSSSHFESFSSMLEEQISKHVQKRPVNVDFVEVVQHVSVKHNEIHVALSCLLAEIAKVQQALNVDFANVLDTKISAMTTTIASEKTADLSPTPKLEANGVAARARKRVREIWAQTESNELADVWCQTDPQLMDAIKKKKNNKKTKDDDKSKKLRPQKTAPLKPLYPDAEAMKQKARAALIRPQYNVQDFYHTTGCVQAIAKSTIFDNVTLGMICLNAIWIAVDTDANDAAVLIDASPIFQVAENFFCSYFTFELLIRFLAFRSKVNCLRDAWFMFDSVLVLMMITETWIVSIVLIATGGKAGAALGSGSILRIIKIVKMLRISRVTRLLRSVPELLILLKGVKAASRSVLVFFSLWLIIIYVYALIFRQLAQGETAYFQTVPDAMNTLLLEGILPDYAKMVNAVATEHIVFWPLMVTFILLAVLTLMNMLVGVLVEVVGAIASTEKESMTVLSLATEMREVMEHQGFDTESSISKQEFQKLLTEPEVTRIVNGVGVDVLVLLDMCETIYEDLAKTGQLGLTFEAFVDLTLNMRGTNPAKVKDVKEQLRLIKAAVADATGSVIAKLNVDLHNLQREIREMREEARDKDENGDDGDEQEYTGVVQFNDAGDQADNDEDEVKTIADGGRDDGDDAEI